MAHTHWGAEALWQQLEPLLPGLSIEVLPEVASTNTRLVERARTDRTPCLLVAEAQTAGRGRLGRAWVSVPGASLTFSIALPLAPRAWSGLSLAVGLAVADALDLPGPTPPRIGLKWPNDLWLVGRKLGGILIETVARDGERIVVAGIGLNLRRQAIDGSASLDEIDPTLDGPAALARIARPLVRALLAFQADGFEAVAAAYARRDVLRGHRVRTTAAGAVASARAGTAERAETGIVAADANTRIAKGANIGVGEGADTGVAESTITGIAEGANMGVAEGADSGIAEGVNLGIAEGVNLGIAEGVDSDGALCVRNAAGELTRVVSGEVSVRLVGASAC